MQMALNMMVNGKMTYNMATELSHGSIIVSSRDTTSKVKSMVKVLITGTMEPCITVNGLRIKWRGMGNINGQMIEHMKEGGMTTICMDRVYTHGKTVDDTKDNMKWTKNMATASTLGLMDVSTRATGTMVSNMGQVN